jgi:hypothetical protein
VLDTIGEDHIFVGAICRDGGHGSITSDVIRLLTGVMAQHFVMTWPLLFCSVESNANPETEATIHPTDTESGA